MNLIKVFLLATTFSLNTATSFELGASLTKRSSQFERDTTSQFLSPQTLLQNDLWGAAREGKAAKVQVLLMAKANPSRADNWGSTPLHAAACQWNPVVMNLLLDATDYINPSNCSGYTPLHTAVQNGELEVVQALIAKGANLELQENRGLTPLNLAMERSQLTTAMVLVKAGARFYPKTKTTFAQKLTSIIIDGICYYVPKQTCQQQEHENSWLYLLRLSRILSKLPKKEIIIKNSEILQAWMHYKPHPSLIELCQLVVIEHFNKRQEKQLPTKNLEIDEEELEIDDQQAASGSSWPCFLS